MKVDQFFLQQLESESCLWVMRNAELPGIFGILVTYVDDLLVLSTEDLARRWVDEIKRRWEVSEPEKVEDGKPTRFLGMELSRDQHGQWRAAQEAYTNDLLIRNLGPDVDKWPRRKIPMAREEEEQKAVEPDRSPAEVREAQRVVGELIWLVTRCRPDIMYVTSVMSTLTTRQPSAFASQAHGLSGLVLPGCHHGGGPDFQRKQSAVAPMRGCGYNNNNFQRKQRQRRPDGLHGCVVWRRGRAWMRSATVG